MYPTRISILAKEKQKYINRMVYMQFVRNSVEVLLFLLCASTIFLVGSWWTLQSHFNDLASKLTIKVDTETERTVKIKEINRLLSDMQGLQSIFVTWTPKIKEFEEAIPDGVTLTNLSLSAYGKTYKMSGVADTRDSLLALEELLLNLPEVTDVDIPLAQLIPKEDINFSITIDVQ